ncbi:hypothetical protein PIB30_057098 [Stylosanthes scabra]|uniref:Uncharacterized protein n=1 Tax=Stylosanthes scabra TaxID=79078 RepID=A0ABU6WHT3_9FABA|nr:hypothetical protein [Stylosanthes scabra]
MIFLVLPDPIDTRRSILPSGLMKWSPSPMTTGFCELTMVRAWLRLPLGRFGLLYSAGTGDDGDLHDRIVFLSAVCWVLGFRPVGPFSIRVSRFPNDLDEFIQLAISDCVFNGIFQVITVLRLVSATLVVITKQRSILGILSHSLQRLGSGEDAFLRDLLIDFSNGGYQRGIVVKLLFWWSWVALESHRLSLGLCVCPLPWGSRMGLGVFGGCYYSVDLFMVYELLGNDLYLLPRPHRLGRQLLSKFIVCETVVRHRIATASTNPSMVLHSALNRSMNFLVVSTGFWRTTKRLMGCLVLSILGMNSFMNMFHRLHAV